MVVQTQSVSSWRPERLYFRTVTDERYIAIGCPYLMSQEYPVLAAARPLLAYNTMLHGFELDAEGDERHFGNWDAVRIFDLQTHGEVSFIGEQTIRFPDGVTDGWISQLVAFAGRGDLLHVIAGLSRDGLRSMEYCLAELDIQSHAVRPLALLPAVFM
ncbi:MAG TPA: hypothetical protein VNW97_17285 [Candidatus Saccharimonadales bacterium]|nr:hypothetical protein [Candidatus Saccharimonadales bacterium]